MCWPIKNHRVKCKQIDVKKGKGKVGGEGWQKGRRLKENEGLSRGIVYMCKLRNILNPLPKQTASIWKSPRHTRIYEFMLIHFTSRQMTLTNARIIPHSLISFAIHLTLDTPEIHVTSTQLFGTWTFWKRIHSVIEMNREWIPKIHSNGKLGFPPLCSFTQLCRPLSSS